MLEALQSNSPKDVDENDFIDASRLVYDGVREIRRAVLMNRVSENCFLKCPNCSSNATLSRGVIIDLVFHFFFFNFYCQANS